MNDQHIKHFVKALQKCETMHQVFATCETFYELNEGKLNAIHKGVVITGIKTAIQLIKPREKIINVF